MRFLEFTTELLLSFRIGGGLDGRLLVCAKTASRIGPASARSPQTSSHFLGGRSSSDSCHGALLLQLCLTYESFAFFQSAQNFRRYQGQNQ